jgi:hypothetical protein
VCFLLVFLPRKKKICFIHTTHTDIKYQTPRHFHSSHERHIIYIYYYYHI